MRRDRQSNRKELQSKYSEYLFPSKPSVTQKLFILNPHRRSLCDSWNMMPLTSSWEESLHIICFHRKEWTQENRGKIV